MIRKDFIIDKARNHLAEFLGPIAALVEKRRVFYVLEISDSSGYIRPGRPPGGRKNRREAESGPESQQQ